MFNGKSGTEDIFTLTGTRVFRKKVLIMKQKGTVLPIKAMKAYHGRRGIAPLTLKIGTK